VLILAQHFVKKFAKELGKPVPQISERALEVLKDYPWPGNVRELENIIQRLVVMTDGDIIDVPDLPPLMRFSALREVGLRRTLAQVESEYIQNVLASVGGNKSRAAEILGIDRKTLRKHLKEPSGVDR
jgi:DNA-binding NtrC family response regulator